MDDELICNSQYVKKFLFWLQSSGWVIVIEWFIRKRYVRVNVNESESERMHGSFRRFRKVHVHRISCLHKWMSMSFDFSKNTVLCNKELPSGKIEDSIVYIPHFKDYRLNTPIIPAKQACIVRMNVTASCNWKNTHTNYSAAAEEADCSSNVWLFSSYAFNYICPILTL